MSDITKDWFKSSASTGFNNCVEARILTSAVEVRDSKDKGIPALRVNPGPWASFIEQFDNASQN